MCEKKNNSKLRTVDFHNLAQFDGIWLIRYYADRLNRYRIKPLVRKNQIYELKVYIGNNWFIHFWDSCTLLPRSLASLGKTLCPELGLKGSIPHSDLIVFDLQGKNESLINDLWQDILLLGGVILKAQERNWYKYQIDIEDVMTVSALSQKIVRKKDLDDKAYHINIPTRNQDTILTTTM